MPSSQVRPSVVGSAGRLCTAAASVALFLAAGPAAVADPLPSGWDARKAADETLAGLIPVTAPSVKGAHDADLAFAGGKAFVVYEANDRRPGESAAWPWVYVALSVVDPVAMRVEKVIPVAQSGQAFANETLPEGACFVPRLVPVDARTLRCFFASESPGKRQSQVWYTDLDTETLTFTNRIRRARLKTAAGVFDMQPKYFHADAAAAGFRRPAKDYGLYVFDPVKEIGGKLYVTLNNYPGGQNALAVLNDAGTRSRCSATTTTRRSGDSPSRPPTGCRTGRGWQSSARRPGTGITRSPPARTAGGGRRTRPAT